MKQEKSDAELKNWFLDSRNVLPDHVHILKRLSQYVSRFQRRVISPKHHVHRVKRVGRIICIRRKGVS